MFPGQSLRLAGISVSGNRRDHADGGLHSPANDQHDDDLVQFQQLWRDLGSVLSLHRRAGVGTLANVNAFLANPGDLVYTASNATGPDMITVTAAGYSGTPDLFSGGNGIPILVRPPLTNCVPTFAVAENSSLSASSPGVFAHGPSGLYAVLATEAKHGFVILSAGGSFTYTPDTGYVGPDDFSYYSWDGYTRSVLPETVELAVGGDGDSCMCRSGASTVFIFAEVVDIVALGQPPSTAMRPGETAHILQLEQQLRNLANGGLYQVPVEYPTLGGTTNQTVDQRTPERRLLEYQIQLETTAELNRLRNFAEAQLLARDSSLSVQATGTDQWVGRLLPLPIQNSGFDLIPGVRSIRSGVLQIQYGNAGLGFAQVTVGAAQIASLLPATVLGPAGFPFLLGAQLLAGAVNLGEALFDALVNGPNFQNIVQGGGGALLFAGAAALAATNTGTNVVYRSVNAAGEVQYVGITNNFARRAAEHLRSRGLQIEPLMRNLSRSDARAVEQALIEIHGLGANGSLLNGSIASHLRIQRMRISCAVVLNFWDQLATEAPR